MAHPNFRKLNREQRQAVRGILALNSSEAVFAMPVGKGLSTAAVIAIESAVYPKPKPGILVIAASSSSAKRWVKRFAQWGSLPTFLAIGSDPDETEVIVTDRESFAQNSAFLDVGWDLVFFEHVRVGEKVPAGLREALKQIRTETGRFWQTTATPFLAAAGRPTREQLHESFSEAHAKGGSPGLQAAFAKAVPPLNS